MIKADESTEVALELERLHFFNAETDAALLVEDNADRKKPSSKKEPEA